MRSVIVQPSQIHGQGVFAVRNFRQGDLIIIGNESRVITPDNPLRKDEGEYDYHCDYLTDGKIILLQWPERHINHCCDPNSYVKHVGSVRYNYARREIRTGEEITHDYCINGFGNTGWQCNCSCWRCRNTIHSDFFHLPFELQIEYLPLLDGWYIEEYRDKINTLRRVAELQSFPI